MPASRRRHLPRAEEAAWPARRSQRAYRPPRIVRLGDGLAVIRPRARRDRLEGHLIGPDGPGLTDPHGGDRLGAEAGRGEAKQGHADADMGERAAPGRQRQADRARHAASPSGAPRRQTRAAISLSDPEDDSRSQAPRRSAPAPVRRCSDRKQRDARRKGR